MTFSVVNSSELFSNFLQKAKNLKKILPRYRRRVGELRRTRVPTLRAARLAVLALHRTLLPLSHADRHQQRRATQRARSAVGTCE